MPDQCYFNGNFYQCKTPTSAGESPATAAAKWSKVQIPSSWRWVLSRLVYSNMLDQDGQMDKANAARQEAIMDERRGLDWMIRQQANREGFLERPQLRQRNFV